jgi:BCD family chlorophyll transporter-like MFS transporter
MKNFNQAAAKLWASLGPKYMPFADAASNELPLGRLLRLALFQVSVGMAIVLLNGTLNRVMIVELSVPVWLVSVMISLPLLFAPFRALIGHGSDNHKSVLGWRRVPYIWMGTFMQFGGLAILPFALLVLAEKGQLPYGLEYMGAAIAFLLIGGGLHTTQTAGLALATDIAPSSARPRVVALLYVMLLVGMVGSSLLFSYLLIDFSPMRLVQIIQGAAAVTFALNVIALWQQEKRNTKLTSPTRERQNFSESWKQFRQAGKTARLLVVVGLGTAAFNMQDILLEPYGGEILGLSVSATTLLTAILSTGMLLALAFASHRLSKNTDPARLAGLGVVIGIMAMMAVLFSAPLNIIPLFYMGTGLIGFGGGLFAVGTLIFAMGLAGSTADSTSDTKSNSIASKIKGSNVVQSGMALGAWGAVQATAAGVAIALGGGLRDVFSNLAMQGDLGPALISPVTGYGTVYSIEIVLLFVTLVAIGPLVKNPAQQRVQVVAQQDKEQSSSFGLAGFPG